MLNAQRIAKYRLFPYFPRKFTTNERKRKKEETSRITKRAVSIFINGNLAAIRENIEFRSFNIETVSFVVPVGGVIPFARAKTKDKVSGRGHSTSAELSGKSAILFVG